MNTERMTLIELGSMVANGTQPAFVEMDKFIFKWNGYTYWAVEMLDMLLLEEIEQEHTFKEICTAKLIREATEEEFIAQEKKVAEEIKKARGEL